MWWVWKSEDLRGKSQLSSNTPKRKGRKQNLLGAFVVSAQSLSRV